MNQIRKVTWVRWVLVCWFASCLGSTGCGDDDDAVGDASVAEDAAAPSDASHSDASGSDASGSVPSTETDQLADGVVGSSCSADAECGDGRCMLAERITGTAYPGGFCTGGCLEDDDCGAGGVCVPGFRGRIGSCGLRCEDDADCREGYRCRTLGGTSRCAPGPKPLPDHVAGNACEDDTDCGGEAMTCASVLGELEAADGYCSQACAIDDDCGAGGVCISGVNSITLAIGTCYGGCTIADGCREGYTCLPLSGHADVTGACKPE